MKSALRIHRLWTRTSGALALLLLATCFGSTFNTLRAQEGGWYRWVDPVERAFSMEVPQGWHARGGVYRFGYGDVRVMVDLWSPDGKINVRYGDVWFAEPYAVPDRYHREGEQQDLGALGKGTFAAYRTGQDFAEIYGRRSFSGVCRSLTPQRTITPTVPDTSVHRQRGGAVSAGEVTFRCDTPQGTRIAYATAKTTLSTNQPFADAPSTTGWTPDLASYLAPADQVSDAAGILRHFVGSFKLSPRWQQYQNDMDRQGTAYAMARAQGRINQQQRTFQSYTQRMNAHLSQVRPSQSRNQANFENFDLALNGQVPTNDPTHPTVDHGTHQGKWNCGGATKDSDISPGPGCVRIN